MAEHVIHKLAFERDGVNLFRELVERRVRLGLGGLGD